MGFGLATSGDKRALPTWNLRSERPHVICGELMGVVSDSGAGRGWGGGGAGATGLMGQAVTTRAPGVLDKVARGAAPGQGPLPETFPGSGGSPQQMSGTPTRLS